MQLSTEHLGRCIDVLARFIHEPGLVTGGA
jgi:hypothetical protein